MPSTLVWTAMFLTEAHGLERTLGEQKHRLGNVPIITAIASSTGKEQTSQIHSLHTKSVSEGNFLSLL